jgi:hypothetical protein
MAVVHPDCAFGFVDAVGRTELVGEGLAEDGGSIASRVRPGSGNYSEDLASLLRFGAAQLMLRRLLERAEAADAPPYGSATELMRATGHGITLPTAAHFVNSLSAKGVLLPGHVALDPRRAPDLLAEARTAQLPVEIVTPGYGGEVDDLLPLLADAARRAKVRVVLAGHAAAAERGLRPLGRGEPLVAYVAAKDLSPLRAALRAALRDRGEQLVRCAVDEAALVLAVPPTRTAIFDAAGTSGGHAPLLVGDELQIWLDGREGWGAVADGEEDADAGEDLAAAARRAAARAVERLHPLLRTEPASQGRRRVG